MIKNEIILDQLHSGNIKAVERLLVEDIRAKQSAIYNEYFKIAKSKKGYYLVDDKVYLCDNYSCFRIYKTFSLDRIKDTRIEDAIRNILDFDDSMEVDEQPARDVMWAQTQKTFCFDEDKTNINTKYLKTAWYLNHDDIILVRQHNKPLKPVYIKSIEKIFGFILPMLPYKEVKPREY